MMLAAWFTWTEAVGIVVDVALWQYILVYFSAFPSGTICMIFPWLVTQLFLLGASHVQDHR